MTRAVVTTENEPVARQGVCVPYAYSARERERRATREKCTRPGGQAQGDKVTVFTVAHKRAHVPVASPYVCNAQVVSDWARGSGREETGCSREREG